MLSKYMTDDGYDSPEKFFMRRTISNISGSIWLFHKNRLSLHPMIHYIKLLRPLQWLKQYAILDVSIIAIGFVMRVLIGGVTTDIWISHWLVMMTFLVTLFLAFTKRNDDYRIYEKTGQKPRVSITGYNKTFINEATAIIASVTLVCYIMYTMSPEVIERMGTRYVYLTSGWVLAGMLRYLQNMIVYL